MLKESPADQRCFCSEALRVDDGLVVCAGEGHVYALVDALPAEVVEALPSISVK